MKCFKEIVDGDIINNRYVFIREKLFIYRLIFDSIDSFVVSMK